eukprot:CAMPEP_0197835858 /NCGR_PEP_ID=MMETSP1437-20131217/27169_1 /TAXON_ID=49252 ORGANISM="Eucampia antarctica, Strain CCMP1452" /NCGR_SAMPLE_ID=MMETSP1437 /ASSEMBLY_ACC=CAM_ASM_001096 /LENGTH=250 /DNA_ID=CAMNT_0043441577 /DNA_START=30 /DNA_END=779 /DNA_ORIENTATION=+
MCTNSFMSEINDLAKLNLKFSKSMPTFPNQNQLVCELSSLGSSCHSIDMDKSKLPNRLHSNTEEYVSNGNKSQLQPPYLVPRMKFFPTATLEVTVLRARGLQTKREGYKERWFNSSVRVSIGEKNFRTKTVRLTKNPTFEGSRGKNHGILDCTEDNLKVEIFDWTPQARSRLIGFCHLPISLVEAQPINGDIPANEVTLPCKMICVPEGSNSSVPFGSVSLSLIRRDAYACWVKEELRERMKESNNNLNW